MYKQLTLFAFACTLAVGCRDNSTTTTNNSTDMATGAGGGGSSGGGGTAGGGGTTGTGDMALTTTTSTIAAMRTAGTYGNFELDNVILLAVNPSGSHMYVQDA